MSWEPLLAVFQAGRLAMWTDASVFYGQIIDPAKTQVPPENVGIATLPRGPRADSPFIVVSWAIVASSKSRNPDAAQQFLVWATSRELAAQGMARGITMARNSVWDDPAVRASTNPDLIATRDHASKNGYPYDRPFMTSVGKARDLIGELIIESINSKGASPRIQALAVEKAAGVNDLLKADGEYGGN
jgi:multiple sugar transport system substrate-binding protein